jgi:hypothetical protein
MWQSVGSDRAGGFGFGSDKFYQKNCWVMGQGRVGSGRALSLSFGSFRTRSSLGSY